MTTAELPRELAGGDPPLAVSDVLSLCDRIVGEFGRRQHIFGWLRAPDAGIGEWLPVDGYYPSNRLVVVWQTGGPHAALYAELVPAHGLHLLELRPGDLPGDRNAVAAALRVRLDGLGPAPPRPTEAVVHAGPLARAVASLAPVAPPGAPAPRRTGQTQAEAAARGARFVSTHKAVAPPSASRQREPRAIPRATRPSPRIRQAVRTAAAEPPHGAAEAETFGVLVGLALCAVLLFEVFAGVVGYGLNGGHVLLAFALACDVCARALGAIAAGRAGEAGWAWACALGGSPLVASFAVFQAEGPVTVEPAPLAGLLSLVALGVAALAVVGAAMGM